MDWTNIAERRLTRARDEVRRAKELLGDGAKRTNELADSRYQRALRELAAAERFVARVTRREPLPVEDGQGLFG